MAVRAAAKVLLIAGLLAGCSDDPAQLPEPAGDAEEAALKRAEEMIEAPREVPDSFDDNGFADDEREEETP